MEPENHSVVEEHSLPTVQLSVSMFIVLGVTIATCLEHDSTPVSYRFAVQ